MDGLEDWWAQGERVRIALGGHDRAIFVARMGAGPAMTLLHGFPSCSHDWAKLAPALAKRHSLLMPDFLGFGASEKPVAHTYSLHEQTDLVEALWAREGVTSTVVVAHDYAVSVAQELLARRAAGSLAVELSAVHLLNGGLYPDVHRLQPGQTALLDPEQGPTVAARIDEQLFVAGLRPTFAETFDAAPDSADIWRSVSRDEGMRILHLLVRYVLDRQAHEQRWVTALESADVPLSFIWGMLDPVSGAHMAARIHERMPAAPRLELEDVGHWPQLEVPQLVSAAILGA